MTAGPPDPTSRFSDRVQDYVRWRPGYPPQVVEAPVGRYANTAPESAVRAVRACAPYVLPPEKYPDWKEVKITFDPRAMGA